MERKVATTPIFRGTRDVKTLCFRYNFFGVERTITTPVKGRPEHFRKKTMRFELRGNIEENLKTQYRESNEWLGRFADGFRDMVSRMRSDMPLEGIKRLESDLLDECSGIREEVAVRTKPVDVPMDAFKDILDDRRGTVASSTLHLYKANLNFVLGRLSMMGVTRFSELDAKVLERYVDGRQKEGKGISKVNTEMESLKMFLKVAVARGLASDEVYDRIRVFKPKKSKHEVHREKIALTEEEVELLWNHKTTNAKLERARDLFLVCLATSQRISDINALDCSKASDTACVGEVDGVKLLTLTQRKTGSKVTVPLEDRVYDILKKHDFVLPRISSNLTFNTQLRTLCLECGGTFLDDVLVKKRGGSAIVKRWELVSSHTARRSAITNWLMRGLDTLTVSKLSGHHSLEMVRRYDRRTPEANAVLVHRKLFG